MFIDAVKLIRGRDLLLEPASSVHLRKCSFWHLFWLHLPATEAQLRIHKARRLWLWHSTIVTISNPCSMKTEPSKLHDCSKNLVLPYIALAVTPTQYNNECHKEKGHFSRYTKTESSNVHVLCEWLTVEISWIIIFGVRRVLCLEEEDPAFQSKNEDNFKM